MRIPDALTTETAPQLGKAEIRETEDLKQGRAVRETSVTPWDEMRLSDFSKAIREAAAGDPESRTERVARLSAEYASGRYNVDPAALSRSLIEGAIGGG